MIDLMIGIDGVQRRTRKTFDDGKDQRARQRPVATVRTTTAATLRALAERIEPVGTPATITTRP